VNWEAVGTIAEIVGAVGVIASLLDHDISQSHTLIIRMFARTEYFPAYWRRTVASSTKNLPVTSISKL